MPKTQKTKSKRSVTLNIGLISAIKKRCRQNGNGFSEEIEQALRSIYESEGSYIKYELKRAIETVDAIKFRVIKHNSNIDIDKLMKEVK